MANATIRDVARLAEVSLGTVSNYLNGNKRVADRTRARIDDAVEKLEFVPNSAVRVLHGHRSHVLAFIVPDGTNPFFREVARGIEDVAVSRGHVVVSCNTEGDPMREQHYVKALSEMRVRAAIAVASPTTDSLLSKIKRTGARAVMLGSPTADRFSSIVVDDRLGGRLAMEHLLALGRKGVVLLGGPGAAPQIRERLAGYQDAIRAAGSDLIELRRIDAASGSVADRSAAAREVLTLSPTPDAVVCANDMLALALETEAIRAGVRVPDDLAIVGYDDIEPAAAAPIPLTTVHQPQYEIGRRAAELAFAEPDEPATFVSLDPHLVPRWSTLGPNHDGR